MPRFGRLKHRDGYSATAIVENDCVYNSGTDSKYINASGCIDNYS